MGNHKEAEALDRTDRSSSRVLTNAGHFPRTLPSPAHYYYDAIAEFSRKYR